MKDSVLSNGVELADAQYHGDSGSTAPCVKAIAMLLSSDEVIKSAYLISYESAHAFIIFNEYEHAYVIRPGFRSGYPGQGPHGLAVALKMLDRHRVDIDEYVVDSQFMERVESSFLLVEDLENLRKKRPVRPQRWCDYIDNVEGGGWGRLELSHHYPFMIPFALIDERIIDIAVSFFGNEDASLVLAYRRLEDSIRKRTGLSGEGTKLFSRAFMMDESPLKWDVPDEGEKKGRANIFMGCYMSFRNARAHREIKSSVAESLRELMLVNELFRLEAESLMEHEILEKKASEKSIQDFFDGRING